MVLSHVEDDCAGIGVVGIAREVATATPGREPGPAIAQGTTIGRSYAYYIVAGTRIPHPRHYPNLAALVGVELPRTFAAAVSAAAGS
jgi:hypothetical protein